LSVGLFLFAEGCYAPASYQPLLEKDQPAQLTAIVPVMPSDVKVVGHDVEDIIKNLEEIARECNAILDTLSAGSKNTLLGPSKTKDALGGELESFNLYLNDPDPFDSPWKQIGLTELFRKLEVSQVVLIKPTVAVTKTSFPTYVKWSGRVSVSVELLRLSPPGIVARKTGTAVHWSEYGVKGFGGGMGAIIFPYGIGKTFRRSMDQAIRSAFSQLFNPQATGK
jgi:hypothetical protein